MNIEKITEPIRVLADCTGGEIRPLRFWRQGRTYVVQRLNARWIDRQADRYCLHYSVQVGQETYHLHFSSEEVQWWLDEVIVS
jgi:hypothetical protein